jgi:hypothetical protein
MAMPGFSAESAIRGGQRGRSRSAFHEAMKPVQPAVSIYVDGIYYCEGEVDEFWGGVQCYGANSGYGGRAGDGLPPT